MQRTIMGIGVGGVGGFATGFAVGCLFVGHADSAPLPAIFAVILGGAGVAAGAVAGGVADLLAFLRSAFADLDMTPGLEADYGDERPAG